MVSDTGSSRKKLESDDRQQWVIDPRVVDNVFSEPKDCVEVHQADTRADEGSRKHERKSCLQCCINRIDVYCGKRCGRLNRMVETMKVAPKKWDFVLNSMSPVPCDFVCARCGSVSLLKMVAYVSAL